MGQSLLLIIGKDACLFCLFYSRVQKACTTYRRAALRGPDCWGIRAGLFEADTARASWFFAGTTRLLSSEAVGEFGQYISKSMFARGAANLQVKQA
jgi:hypothetical protein